MKLKRIEGRYLDDLIRIQRVLAENGWEASLSQCDELWTTYSNSMSAGWILLPENDETLIDILGGYIEEEV